MNGVIGMARGIRKSQESHERHLSLMLRDLVGQGVAVRARDTDTVQIPYAVAYTGIIPILQVRKHSPCNPRRNGGI